MFLCALLFRVTNVITPHYHQNYEKKQSSVTIPSLQKGHEGAKKDIKLRKGKLECTFVSLYSNILLKFLHRRQLASKGRELNAPAYSPSVKAEG